MYVYAKSPDRRRTSGKPAVLLVLQGIHHLLLYENVFRYCTAFDWYCVLPQRPKDLDDEGRQEADRIHYRYGVRFFTDGFAALAHFPQLDAVITTWSVPHQKHLPYLRYITLAAEVGIPVFELQHGLFQIGLTYNEDAPFAGSGKGVAVAIPDAPNFTSEVLEWSGPNGIGYPRSPFADTDRGDPTTRRRRVTFITNHHWGILREEERNNCYQMMADAILAFPQAEFVVLPHSGDLQNATFRDIVKSLGRTGAGNFRIEERRFGGVYDGLLMNSDLLVASASTTILDCELSQTPTVIFRNPSQDGLTRILRSAVLFQSSDELIRLIGDVLYRNYRPELVTGFADPFRPEALEQRVEGAIAAGSRKPRHDVLIAVARHLGAPAQATAG
jgi:hypothetical protein